MLGGWRGMPERFLTADRGVRDESEAAYKAVINDLVVWQV